MVDHEFYANSYLGSLIPEKAFPAAAERARQVLERFRRVYRVESSGPESEKMALCAMAEAVYAASQRRGGISSATVGSVSVRYETGTAPALMQELYQKACIYLDIYRGASR